MQNRRRLSVWFNALLRWPSLAAPALSPSVWRRGAAAGQDTTTAITAVMLGAQCFVARVQGGTSGALPALVQADAGGPEMLRQWRKKGWFDGSTAVLVLPASERHFLTLEQPGLSAEELVMAARYPLCEAMEAEPEDLLTTAVPMPCINDAQRTQMLAVGTRLRTVRHHMAQLSAAGIELRGVDTCDTALRGMALLDGEHEGGTIVLSYVGDDICIGLLWQGRFCALRSLPLTRPATGEDAEFEEQLALQIQRTVDHFERQATQLAVRQVLGSMPGMEERILQTVLSALPLPARAFDFEMALAPSASARQACQRHPELLALACVAAARWMDGSESGTWPASPQTAATLQPAASTSALTETVTEASRGELEAATSDHSFADTLAPNTGVAAARQTTELEPAALELPR